MGNKLIIALKATTLITVIFLASIGVLYVLDVFTTQYLKTLALKTLAIIGIVAAASVIILFLAQKSNLLLFKIILTITSLRCFCVFLFVFVLLTTAHASLHYFGDSSYAREGNSIYYGATEIKNADAKSFELVSGWLWSKDGIYAKDKNHVYRNGELIAWADPKTFRIIQIKNPHVNPQDWRFTSGEYYATDKNYAFFEGEIIVGADPRSFQHVTGSRYSKDSASVFYSTIKLAEADTLTFRLIGNDYAKDKQHVYYQRYLIEGADSPSFKFVTYSYCFAKDKNNVYFKAEKLPGADPDSFELFKNNYEVPIYYDPYAKDKNQVYYANKVITNDVESFNILLDNYSNDYSKDKNNVYYKGVKVTGGLAVGMSFYYMTTGVKKPMSAMVEMEKALDDPTLDRNDKNVLRMFGNYLAYCYQFSQVDKGLILAKKIQDLGPQNPSIYYNSAYLYAQKGQMKKALQQIVLAEKHGHSNKELQKLARESLFEPLYNNPEFQEAIKGHFLTLPTDK